MVRRGSICSRLSVTPWISWLWSSVERDLNPSLTLFCQASRMRKAAILVLMAAVLTFPAFAAEDKKDTTKGGPAGTNVDMPFLMAPLTDADGKLTGYAYISTRLTALTDIFALAVRDKIPFIQDIMVRDVNSTSVATPADPEQVDVAGLEARLLADARKVMGAGKVRLITVCTVQVAELHPVQTPALRAPDDLKALDAHKNPVKSRCES
jgi:hypothetical protein